MTTNADRTKETTTTVGTGNITLLGAVAQFQSFNTAFGTNIWFDYAIVGQTGTEWEVGFGYLSASATLVRSMPKEGSAGDNTLVTFSAGTKDVFELRAGFCATARTRIAREAIVATSDRVRSRAEPERPHRPRMTSGAPLMKTTWASPAGAE